MKKILFTLSAVGTLALFAQTGTAITGLITESGVSKDTKELAASKNSKQQKSGSKSNRNRNGGGCKR